MPGDRSLKKTLRFSGIDEYLDSDSASEYEIPTILPKPADVLHNAISHSDSPETSVSSSSSEGSVITPPPTYSSIESQAVSPQENSDKPILHMSIRPDVDFFWDMAQSPEALDVVALQGADAAIVWKADRAPLSTFTVTVDGIYKWKIAVKSGERGYPTVRDTLMAIREDTYKIAGRSDAEELPSYTRGQVFKAREARCREFSLPTFQEPLRRIDFMLNSRQFLGISPSSETRRFTLNIGIAETED